MTAAYKDHFIVLIIYTIDNASHHNWHTFDDRQQNLAYTLKLRHEMVLQIEGRSHNKVSAT